MKNPEIEAVFAIGGLVVILGSILLVSGLWWARRQARKYPATQVVMKLTKLGWVLILTMLVTLLSGVSSEYWWPNSRFADLLSQKGGHFLWYLIVIVVFWMIESILRLRGINIIEQVKRANSNE